MTTIVAEATAETTIVAEATAETIIVATTEEEATEEEAEMTEAAESESVHMLDTAADIPDINKAIKDIKLMTSMPRRKIVITSIVTAIVVMETAIIQLNPMHHLPETTLSMVEAMFSTVKEVVMEANKVVSLPALAKETVDIKNYMPTLDAAGTTTEQPDHLLKGSTRSQIPKNDRVMTSQVVFTTRHFKITQSYN